MLLTLTLLLLLELMMIVMLTAASQKCRRHSLQAFFLQSSISDKNMNRQKTSLNKTMNLCDFFFISFLIFLLEYYSASAYSLLCRAMY